MVKGVISLEADVGSLENGEDIVTWLMGVSWEKPVLFVCMSRVWSVLS